MLPAGGIRVYEQRRVYENNKQKSKGRFLCLLLALLMVFIDIPFTGSAGNLGAAEVKADTLQDGDAVTIRFKDPTGGK